MMQSETTMKRPEHPNVRLRRELEEKTRELEENERWTKYVEETSIIISIVNIILTIALCRFM